MKRKSKPKAEDKSMDFLDSFNKEAVEEPPKKTIEVKENDEEPRMYKVKVTHPALRIRRAPSVQAEVVDVIQDEGIYTIINEANGWGQIDENKWIMLSYTRIV